MEFSSVNKKWIIYKLVNPNGQIYIGRSINLKGRLANYKNLSKSIIRQRLLYNSLITFGYESHKVEILDTFESDKNHADDKEMFWIRSQMSNYTKWPNGNGLNLTDGGTGANGGVWTKESREKLSNTNRGRKMSKEQIERMSAYFKANPTYSMLGKNHTEATKNRMSLLKKGKPSPHKGKKLSIEAKKKLSETQRLKIGRPIIQYDKNGNIIKEYDSIKSASEGSGACEYTISLIAQGKYPYNSRYHFKYK